MELLTSKRVLVSRWLGLCSNQIVRSELRRLKRMNPSQAEYGMLRTYLETVAELPWNKTTEDNNDIAVATVTPRVWRSSSQCADDDSRL